MIETVTNFLENPTLKSQAIPIPVFTYNDKDQIKLNKFNEQVVKILHKELKQNSNQDIEKLCEKIHQPISIYFTFCLINKLKFIEPKIENSSLLLNEDKKLYSSHFVLGGSTHQTGRFSCYMGDNAKRSLSIDKNQIKENSTYINFHPSEANEDLFMSAFKDTRKDIFYREQDCNDDWIKINNSSKPIIKTQIQQEPER